MLLLDTCTLLWLVQDQTRLSALARQHIAAGAGSVFVSAISAFEIGLKYRKGRLSLPLEPEAWIQTTLRLHGLVEIPVDCKIAVRSTQLPPVHADPADRLLVATAQLQNLLLLTPDPLIHAYPGLRVAW